MRGRKRCIYSIAAILCLVACSQSGTPIDDGGYNSGLYYIQQDDRESYIAKPQGDGTFKRIIHARVLGFVVLDGTLIAARQPLIYWECGDGSISGELSESIEYWTLNLKRILAKGPYSYAEVMQQSLENEQHIVEAISPNLIEKNTARLKLRNCPEPREQIAIPRHQ